jgi:hypothetical protein
VQAVVRSPEVGWQFIRILEEGGDFDDVFPLSEGQGGEFHYTMRYRPRPAPGGGAIVPSRRSVRGAPQRRPRAGRCLRSTRRRASREAPLARPPEDSPFRPGALNVGVYLAYTMPRSLQARSAAARAVVLRGELERDRRVTAALRDRADAMKTNRTTPTGSTRGSGPKARWPRSAPRSRPWPASWA